MKKLQLLIFSLLIGASSILSKNSAINQLLGNKDNRASVEHKLDKNSDFNQQIKELIEKDKKPLRFTLVDGKIKKLEDEKDQRSTLSKISRTSLAMIIGATSGILAGKIATTFLEYGFQLSLNRLPLQFLVGGISTYTSLKYILNQSTDMYNKYTSRLINEGCSTEEALVMLSKSAGFFLGVGTILKSVIQSN